ncbi:uncharacterized protein STEHIDRAFT_155506 [Stereum hirsutum FP-91666 SS1]|uniref:uncharacterized protein n=1 Tax=Stereum hirsutum (strain FP-91666) TaxID=721885 RepID=UPI000440A566|nr:uncharacterized protein STEHIDRAFT_155506 [Stereum hirsutum FP-91666 SS1]EIM88149.1 hypothetical protein STEHIDRAFT_155506 [Stereum hirsutum FP-91666 SS1]
MDFTKINDPAGVQALLESLRRSQAFTDSVTGTEASSNSTSSQVSGSHSHSAEDSSLASTSKEIEAVGSNPSVASLLSQLQSSTAVASAVRRPAPPPPSPPGSEGFPTTVRVHPPYASLPVITANPSPPPRASSTSSESVAPIRKQDARAMSFQQALPRLAQMSEDAEFVDAVNKMKEEQNKLERQLLEERQEIQRKHQEKVKLARTKASMIGAGLSKHEAEMMSTAFRKELHKFDVERALVAWDGMVAKQQMALEVLAVPTMFVGSNTSDMEKQKKVMRVLEGIVGGDNIE